MHEIRLRTERRTEVVDITAKVRDAVGSATDASAVLVYVPHTTAGVTINEHADPALKDDLSMAAEHVVRDDWVWRHSDADGPNAPAHVRASLTGSQVLIPVDRGGLALGTWQGIFFCEYDGPRDRKVYVTTLR